MSCRRAPGRGRYKPQKAWAKPPGQPKKRQGEGTSENSSELVTIRGWMCHQELLEAA
jgi:hypothetical protein